MDARLALRILAELHREFQHPLNMAYIDMKAAFDSVDRTSLWKVLRGNGVPSSLLNLIWNLHGQTTARVRVDTDLSSPFPTSSGIRQGCILTPSLLCCAMDWIMSRCSDQLGINVGGEIITDVVCAVDAVLFVRDTVY